MRRIVKVIAGLGAVALFVSGCATTDDTAEQSADGLTKLTVGSISVAGDAPLLIAEEKGIFEKHGLEVEIVPGQNFGAVLPRIQNDELQVGFSSTVPMLNASANGAPIKVFATQEYTDSNPDEATIAVMTPAGSPLTRPRDLEDKTVGVVAKGNSDTLGLLASVANDGGDPTKVNLLELGIGSPLLQGLQQGNVDAIVGGEPTRTLAANAGGQALFYPLVNGIPNLPQGAYFTSDRFAAQNAESLAQFRAAIEEASEYSRSNPDEVRTLLPEFLNIDQELADEVRLPRWDTTYNPDDWQKLADIGMKYEMVDERVDLSKLLLDVS